MRCSHGGATSAATWLLTTLLALVALAAAPSSAFAVLLAEERFLTTDSPNGPQFAVAEVGEQNPYSIGFSGPWFPSFAAASSVASVNSTSLDFANASFPSEAGGKLLSATSNARVHRKFATSNPFETTDSGTVYLSLLLQTGTNNGYRAFEMHNGGNDDSLNRTLQLGLSSSGDFPNTNAFGFRVNNNGALEFQLGAEDTAVHLFLVKFSLSTTNNADTITVWNNPSLASVVSDPAGGVTASGFNFAADRLGIGHFTGTAVGLDELRIGTTLRDVLTTLGTCDVNGNGVCNSSDAAIISQHMYLAGDYSQGDLNGSGTIDFADFQLFKENSARTAGFDPGAGGGTVPEPASMVLLGMVLVVCSSMWLFRLRSAAPFRSGVGAAILAALAVLAHSSVSVRAAEFDLLNDTIGFSGATLNLRPYATMPAGFNNVIEMTHRPADSRMYVATEQGSIFVVNENPGGSTTPALFFNAASALQTATGRSMNFNGSQQGLQSVAFHPNFDDVGQPGYGKLYTTMLENRPANPNDPSHFYLGNSTYGNGGADGVLVEWTFDHNAGQVDASSYRELFRTNMPNYDHPIKLAQFNPYAGPGDEDYGLLYLTHGDSNNQDSLNNDPQDRGDVLGKMLRINPLQSGADRYTIPSTNPFFSTSDPSPAGTPILGEVYAYGFRNPHNFSFSPDDEGNIRIVVGDIGRSNMEEINLVEPGGNFGWTKREGTFIHKQGNTYPPNASPNAGYIYGVTPLAETEASDGIGPDGNNYIYPVAQYDHNGPAVVMGQDFTATSVASSFRIHNGSDPALDNQFVFLNFAFNHGDVYHTDFDEMLNAVTQLDSSDPLRNSPDDLTQAQLQRLHLTLDGDSNPNTPPTASDNMNTVLGVFRNDSRFGEGLSGEMYVSTKNGGAIYLVTNTIPGLTLTVDRGTGAMAINNNTRSNVDVNGISLSSPSGSLDPAAFQSVDSGWDLSPGNSSSELGQSNAAGSLVLTNATTGDLGNAYNAQLMSFGNAAGEDLTFEYSLEGGGTANGYVKYVGTSPVINTIVLTIDLASGHAVMLNQTPFSQDVEGYTISSGDGSIDMSGWSSLAAQGVDDGDWLASPPLATRLTEIQADGTTTFDNLTPYDLGSIFQTGGEQDLELQFLLAGEASLRTGKVVYILAGDYNGDEVVNAADYTVWRNHLGTSDTLPNDMSPGIVTVEDYAVWKQNFGAVLPAGAGGGGAAATGAAAVPEPASLLLLVGAALATLAMVRTRKLITSARRPAADLRFRS